MAAVSDQPCDPNERNTVPSVEEVLDAVEKLLRAALQQDRPQRQADREAVDVYRANEDSRGKTVAVLAACLSDWKAFSRHLDEVMQEKGPLSMDVIAAQCIHRVSLRKRRVGYREKQMSEQVRAANVRDKNDEWKLFDPADPRKWEESLKDLRGEIAFLLEGRSVRDRMVIELSIDGYTGREIVEQVEAAVTGERISEAMVSRIWTKFKHDLRQRLEGEQAECLVLKSLGGAMLAIPERVAALSQADREVYDCRAEQFEAAWEPSSSFEAQVGQFLPSDGPVRLPLLVHMAKCDMEFRRRQGETRRVEDYLNCFAELEADEAAIVSLLLCEYNLIPADEPRVENFASRFSPEVQSLFRAALADLEPVGAWRDPEQYEVDEQPLGRGSWGVVYRAKHKRFGRFDAIKRVAVETATGRQARDVRAQVQRLRAEIPLAARLEHPNIVRLYADGISNGHPYFIMEFCSGGTLAKHLSNKPMTPRKAADLIKTLAEAVDAVHRFGLIHRDLKPDNVLFTEDGIPKIADFGLALRWERGESAAVRERAGTPLYMAPEQVDPRRANIGPATDVYGLGAILYECLTGKPPFPCHSVSENHQVSEVYRRVCNLSPPPPRKLNPKISRDLNAICLKCLEKEPGKRYATAAQLASDLGRFLAEEPVGARPHWLAERGWMWAKRRPTVAALVVVCVFTVLSAGIIGWNWSVQRAGRRAGTAQTVNVALAKGEQWADQAEASRPTTSAQAATVLVVWDKADASVDEAQAALRTGEGEEPLRQHVEEVRQRLAQGRRQTEERQGKLLRKERLFRGLDEARMAMPTWKGSDADWASAAVKYAAAFAEFGLKIQPGQMEVLTQRIHDQEPAVRDALIVSLQYWAFCAKQPVRADLLAIVRATDQDAWRGDCRRAERQRDGMALVRLSKEARDLTLPPESLELLALALNNNDKHQEALDLLRWAHGHHPTDFWIALKLGHFLEEEKMAAIPVILEEQIGCFRVAVALRPDASVAHFSLGNSLYYKKQVNEAISEFNKAIALDPNLVIAHEGLGVALYFKNQLDNAIVELKKTIVLDPKRAHTHVILGLVLYAKNQPDEAIAEYKIAIALDSKLAPAYFNLGFALAQKKQLDEAIAEYKKAIALEPNDAEAHVNLGLALHDNKQLDEAIAEYKKAIALEPNDAKVHFNLGSIFQTKKRLDEAIAEYKKAIALDSKLAPAHVNLGLALHDNKQLDEAIVEYEKAIALEPNDAKVHFDLGRALYANKQLDDAIAEFNKAIVLDPKFALAHYNLGIALDNNNQLDDAIAEYNKAIAFDPKAAQAHGVLGEALLRKGRFADAKTSTQNALDLLPEKDPLRPRVLRQRDLCDTLLGLEAKLPEILAGKAQPKDNAERLRFLAVCQLQKRHAAVAKLYGDAFTADANLANDLYAGNRYHAACAAALAAAGQGKDADKLSDQERADLRKQALQWLRADLAALEKLLDKDADKARTVVHHGMTHWKQDTDLTGVRDPKALAKLPPDERAAWQKLWQDVDALLAKAAK